MSDAERVWRSKSDEEVAAAAGRLGEYTPEGQRIIRDELRRRGFRQPSAPPASQPEPPHSNPSRYSDGYRAARSIVAFGAIIKSVGALVAVLLLIASVLASERLEAAALVGVVTLAIIVGFGFWIVGVLVSAQGELLRASLDTAIYCSPLLSNEEKARITNPTWP